VEKGINLLIKLLPSIPKSPGIYKMLSKQEVLYIGKAKDLSKRLASYAKSNVANKTRCLVSSIDDVNIIVTTSEEEALLLEMNLIKEYQPKYNVLFKDDKTFAYIKFIDDHKFPQLIKYRSKSINDDTLYGPFASDKSLKDMLSTIQKIFKIRNCSDSYFANRKRPCLQYEIQRCTAPCVSYISEEEYKENVKQAKMFLEGKTLKLQEILVNQMQGYSDKLEYEKAAIIRDKIETINVAQIRSATSNTNVLDFDVIGLARLHNTFCIKVFTYRGGQNYGDKSYFYTPEDDKGQDEILEFFILQIYQQRNLPSIILLPFPLVNSQNISSLLSNLHNKKKLQLIFEEDNTFTQNANENAKFAIENKVNNTLYHETMITKVAKLFNLKQISTIEIYDNSHIMGSYAIGAVVVAGKEGFEKNKYKVYTIQNIKQDSLGGDDYEMLREALLRRIKNMTEEDMPSLIIIDGGKGHLNVAYKILSQLQNPPKLVAMAKGKERNAGKEVFYQIDQEPFTLPHSDKIMHYLQNLRDEVHKLAINTYRKKHIKGLYQSSLDKIEGIGKNKKQILLNYFGSIQNIKNSSLKTLSQVPSIGPKLAEKILKALN
jgi:excinuclease ABC subunit C